MSEREAIGKRMLECVAVSRRKERREKHTIEREGKTQNEYRKEIEVMRRKREKASCKRGGMKINK